MALDPIELIMIDPLPEGMEPISLRRLFQVYRTRAESIQNPVERHYAQSILHYLQGYALSLRDPEIEAYLHEVAVRKLEQVQVERPRSYTRPDDAPVEDAPAGA